MMFVDGPCDDMETTATGCTPQPMAIRDLRCGDTVHVNGYFGVTHWTADGAAHESYPVPGKWHVPKMACGTLAVFTTLDEVVLVCSTRARCGSSLCGAKHHDDQTDLAARRNA
jgi:hypothetical protein